jgi:hypothetical protein
MLMTVDLRLEAPDQAAAERTLVDVRDAISQHVDERFLPWEEHTRLGVVEQARVVLPYTPRGDTEAEQAQDSADFLDFID